MEVRMKYLFFASLTIFLMSCSHHLSQQRHPAQAALVEQKIIETERKLEELQALKQTDNVAIYVDFQDSGLDKSKRRYDVFAQVLTNDAEALEKVELIISGKVVKVVKLQSIDGNLFIREKFMMKLPIHSTKFRFSFRADGSKDIDLVCTRVDQCL